MSILIDRSTRILIQGITGAMGQVYAERMLAGGTPLVGGVTPGKGGQEVAGVPVFNSVREAVARTGATAMLSVVPRAFARDAVYEAVEGGMRTIVVYIENIPVHDAIQMRAYAATRGARLIGPNAAGIVSPGEANLSDLNDANLVPGRIGIISKSGTLTYEVIEGLHRYGMGESTVACIGGDPVIGTTYADLLPLFEDDANTDLVVLVGEPGGHLEYEALPVIRAMRTPVVAYFAGLGAPPEKRMGHAGAISSDVGTIAASVKAAAYRNEGYTVATLITDVAPCVAAMLGKVAGTG